MPQLSVIPATEEADDPPPPTHLSALSKGWWREIVANFELEGHHLRVLQAAAEAFDRMAEARKLVKRHGVLIPDRYGVLKVNPACGVERDSRTSLLRAIRELDLDVEPPKDKPRLSGRR